MNEPQIPHLAEITITYETSIKPSQMAKVSNSSDAEKLLRIVWRQSMDLKECFYTMYLNQNNKVLGVLLISEGGISGTVVDVRAIFQTALKANASNVILAHNHPSGNLNPSEADKKMTNKIKEAGQLLDIAVLDHIILSSESFISFADEGLI